MYSPDDTIVAVATPEGRGGIGVVRLSGPDAHAIACALTGRDRPFTPRHATFARIAPTTGAADQVVVTWFAAPQSYTGEDVVEISAHGSPVLLHGIVAAAMAAGSRLAEPGEFTFRAYLHGRIDLVQAEAVRDLVDAVTPLQARTAFDQLEGTLTHRIGEIDRALFDLASRLEANLDFPDEGYHFVTAHDTSGELDGLGGAIARLLETAARGRLIREGLQATLTGRPNAGKSSLFNLLAGAGRAIVAEQPGTTRDLLTERIDVCGIPVTLVDTAGVRGGATDAVEIEGIARAVAARQTASVSVVVLDRSAPLTEDDRALVTETSSVPRVVVANKSDLAPAWTFDSLSTWSDGRISRVVEVSARTGAGLDDLEAALAAALTNDAPARDTPAISNLRHVDLLEHAGAAVERASAAAAAGLSEEFVLLDVHEARARLEEITGARTPDDLLNAIFASFCIGK